jgi:hypothetical protein
MFSRKSSLTPTPSKKPFLRRLSQNQLIAGNVAKKERQHPWSSVFFPFKKSSNKKKQRSNSLNQQPETVFIERRETIDWSLLDSHSPHVSLSFPVKERSKGPPGRRLPSRVPYSRRNTLAHLPDHLNFTTDPGESVDEQLLTTPPSFTQCVMSDERHLISNESNVDDREITKENFFSLERRVISLEKSLQGLRYQFALALELYDNLDVIKAKTTEETNRESEK